jgi:putative ABC transport system permease protein
MLRELVTSLVGAIRSMRRRPAFFLIGTLTLGLALGFASTIFGIADDLRHPVVPFDDPDRTFSVWAWGSGDAVHPGASYEELYAALRALPAFDVSTQNRTKGMYVGYADRQQGSAIASVPANYFKVVGVRPRLGRLFGNDDIGRTNSVLVSDLIWRAWFNNRAAIGNAEITIGGQIYAVVGVMPRGMRYAPPVDADFWTPIVPGDSAHLGRPTVHLRAGVTRQAAEAQLNALAAQFNTRYNPPRSRAYGFKMTSLRPDPSRLGGGNEVLIVIALCILGIACANIATLTLARAVARRRDLALRLSLGAKTRTLVFDQLAESAVLAIGGGILGVVFAFWAIGGLTHAVPEDIRWLLLIGVQWNWRFFALTLVAAGGVALVTGLLPAWQVAHIQPMEPLKESSGGTTGRSSNRVRFLVAGQLAVSLSLLVGAALITRSALKLGAFQFGFDARHVLSASGYVMYRGDMNKLGANPVETILPRVEAVRGIESASAVATAQPARSQVFSDRTVGIKPLLVENYKIVGAHFMRTMGIPMIRGRDFEAGDDVQGAVILDERAVRALFPDGEALGHSIRLGSDDSAAPWLKVIGIARAADMTVPRDIVAGPRWPPIYASVKSTDDRTWAIVARVSGEAPAVAARLRNALNAFLPGGASAYVSMYSDDFDRSMEYTTFLARMFATLSLASLVLAAAGLFAVLSYAVNQRMREYAVRVAIGATSRHVLGLVARESAELVLAGTGIGAVGGFYAGALLEPGLRGIATTDVVSLIAAELILMLVGCGACIVPALRAMRADPVEVLRAS